jgi:MFS family permease
VGGAVALGPVLGGLLLENPEWFRWLIGNDWGSVFLINVPIVAVGAVGILRLVPETRNPHPQRLDLVGLALSVTGLTVLVYGIIHAGDTKDWLAPSVVGPIVAGLLVLVLFVWLERRSEHKSFDVTLFAHRGFTISLVAVSLTFFAMSGVVFTFPYYLQVLRGYGTLAAGLCFLPFAAGQLLSAPRSGHLVDRFGARAVIITGLAVVTVSLVLLAFLQRDTALPLLLGVFFLFGLGMGAVIAPASTVMQNTLPLARVGAGSAVQNTVRQVFGALGVAIVGTVLVKQYSDTLAPTLDGLPVQVPQTARDALSSSVAAAPEVLQRAQGAGLPAGIVDGVRNGAFDAYLQAAHVATWICASLVIVALLVVAALMPRRGTVPSPHRS